MQNIIIAIVALLVLAGGALAILSNQPASDSMVEDDESGVMQKDDSMQKDEAMMKDESGDEMTPKDSELPTGQVQKEEETTMGEGTYENYSPEKLALANDGKVVMYFHADWCPICRPLDAAFKANVPEGIHILKIDYDTAAELKQKYGVTYQHTFVQVDATGKLIAKWGDAFTAAEVFERIQ